MVLQEKIQEELNKKRINKKWQKNNIILTHNYDYNTFFSKSLGFLTHKGNKSRSENLFNQLLFNLKSHTKTNSFNYLILNFIKLKPFFDFKQTQNKKTRKKLVKIKPKISSLKRKNLLTYRWLYRAPKIAGKTRSVNITDLEKNVIDISQLKGIGMDARKMFLEHAFSNFEGLRFSRLNFDRTWPSNYTHEERKVEKYITRSNKYWSNRSTKNNHWTIEQGSYFEENQSFDSGNLLNLEKKQKINLVKPKDLGKYYRRKKNKKYKKYLYALEKQK